MSRANEDDGRIPPAVRRITVCISMALLLLLAAGPARADKEATDDLRIIIPESLTSVSSESEPMTGKKRMQMLFQSTTGRKVSLVGVVGGGKAEVEIINGFSHVKPVFHENCFHAAVTLSLGVNMIEVRWRRPGGAWRSKDVSIFRSSKVEMGVSSNYPPYTFHKPENEEHCQGCHQMTLTKAEITTGMERSCLRCHSGLVDNLFVHGPVGVGICTICHDPESAPNRYKVQENDNVLCYSCHDDRKNIDGGKKLLHGPVGAGMCTVCHDPHSSPFQYQLVKSKGEICTMCHQEDADRWMRLKSLHPPFKSGNCVGCHDPHSADFKYNLKANRNDICTLCHELPVPGHLHEAGVVPRFKLPEDLPLSEEGRIICLTCHDPHGANGDKMTRREGCDSCHQK